MPGPRYNGAGLLGRADPGHERRRRRDPDDVVIFDEEGYPALRDFLKQNKIRHVLLTGYATDMCYCSTTAGYENLSKDFNVFLVGDASLATFPGNATPRFATNASLSFAAINQLITQISWVQYTGSITQLFDAEDRSQCKKLSPDTAAVSDVDRGLHGRWRVQLPTARRRMRTRRSLRSRSTWK